MIPRGIGTIILHISLYLEVSYIVSKSLSTRNLHYQLPCGISRRESIVAIVSATLLLRRGTYSN